jgi:hypothetical protein
MRGLLQLMVFSTVLPCLAAPTSAKAQVFGPHSEAARTPTKLAKWIGAPDPKPPEPGNRIVTDRPHLAEATSTVGLGRIQIENGYTFYSDEESGTRVQTHSFPETLVRLGVFREWFELRLAYDFFSEKTTAAANSTSITGADDLYVGAKVALTEQLGLLPEFTVFPQMRLPVGHSNFTSGEVLPGINFAYCWMLTEKLELEANTQVNRRHDDGIEHFYTEIFQTFNFEYDLAERFMLFNEFVLISPSGAITAGCQYYEHAGLHYFIRPNLQLDFHAAVGLNRYADDFFGGSGLSWRW